MNLNCELFRVSEGCYLQDNFFTIEGIAENSNEPMVCKVLKEEVSHEVEMAFGNIRRMQQQIAFAEKMRQLTEESRLDSENFEAQQAQYEVEQAQYRAKRARSEAELDAKLAPLRSPPEVPIRTVIFNVLKFPFVKGFSWLKGDPLNQPQTNVDKQQVADLQHTQVAVPVIVTQKLQTVPLRTGLRLKKLPDHIKIFRKSAQEANRFVIEARFNSKEWTNVEYNSKELMEKYPLAWARILGLEATQLAPTMDLDMIVAKQYLEKKGIRFKPPEIPLEEADCNAIEELHEEDQQVIQMFEALGVPWTLNKRPVQKPEIARRLLIKAAPVSPRIEDEKTPSAKVIAQTPEDLCW